MSFRFYKRVLQLAIKDPVFRSKAYREGWDLIKQWLPARLVTPRSKYVYCHVMMDRDKGRWLPPGSLHIRPSAYGIAFDEAGQVLMVGDHFFGPRYSFPGGAVEPGESLVQALEREFEEETGLKVSVSFPIENIDEFAIMPTGQAIHGILHFYLVKVVGGTLLPNGNGFDTGSALFLDIEKVPLSQIGGTETLRRIVQRAHSMQAIIGSNV